jgi:hypothetical protein
VLLENSNFNNNEITDDEANYDECCWAEGWGFVVGDSEGVPTGTNVSHVSSSNNTRGATIFSGGDTTISNSQFDGNYRASPAGLTIWSGGVVTLLNISASNNYNVLGSDIGGGDGLDIFGAWNGGNPGDPYNGSPTHVEIQNSTFSNNGSSAFGYDTVDGVFINIGSGSAKVTGSIFFNNTGYGLTVAGTNTGTLTEYGNYYNHNLLGNFQLGGGTLVTTPLAAGELPGALPAGFTFVSGMNVTAAASGAQVSFDIPAGIVGPFEVLSWDSTQWVEVASSVVDGKVVFTAPGTGIFVLVSG